jgi:hypothetical protein
MRLCTLPGEHTHELRRVLTPKAKENDGEHARSIHSSFHLLLHLFISHNWKRRKNSPSLLAGREESKEMGEKTETDCKN